MSVLVTFAAFLALLVPPTVLVAEFMDLFDAADATRDRALGVRQFAIGDESPDSDRIGPLLAARALVTV